MRISVVIPVLNEMEDLPRTVAALTELPDIHEIVVVDGGSTDGTREWLQHHLPKNGCVVDGPPGRGWWFLCAISGKQALDPAGC
jgi:glycosyltransferase involved in cell wall biosynthesis